MTLTDASASTLRAPSTLRLDGAGYVVCALEELWLVAPQADVVAIEHGSEFSAPDSEFSAPDGAGSRIAWFHSPRGTLPVCVLDSSLQPSDALHASGSHLVIVRSHPVPVALRCQSVRIVRTRSELEVHPLPAIMQGGPVSAVARIDRCHLALVFDKGELPAYLADLVAREEES